MNIFTKVDEIKIFLKKQKEKKMSIGFVPTMGALHQGHISLIEKCREESDITVCSIFVNPVQFNNKEDFEKYPKTIDKDIDILKKAKCDVLFCPSVNEMYPDGEEIKTFDFDYLDKILEGKFRPGHFNGVAVVVEKFFNIIQPNHAYFGEKDFQQLVIIKEIVKKLNLSVKNISCPIVRETDGLAMSSRNVRLSINDRKKAPIIFQILTEAKRKAKNTSIPQLKEWVFLEFEKYSLVPEYFEIADRDTLKIINNWAETEKPIALVAVYLGKIRLIDNLFL